MDNKKKKRKKSARDKNVRIVRRRIAMLAVVIAIIVAILIGLIVHFVRNNAAIPERSLLTIESDGSITCEEVSDFSDSSYDKKELKTFMQQEIKTYTDENGADSVKLGKIVQKNDSIYAKTTYATALDYAHFTKFWLDSTTIENAIDEGYKFADAFVEVTDGAKGDSVDSLDITSQKELKVVIVKENIDVKVDGKILYVSDACTTMVDESTVSISQPDGNEDATQLTYIIYE